VPPAAAPEAAELAPAPGAAALAAAGLALATAEVGAVEGAGAAPPPHADRVIPRLRTEPVSHLDVTLLFLSSAGRAG
jgi:hypothetical protein